MAAEDKRLHNGAPSPAGLELGRKLFLSQTSKVQQYHFSFDHTFDLLFFKIWIEKAGWQCTISTLGN